MEEPPRIESAEAVGVDAILDRLAALKALIDHDDDDLAANLREYDEVRGRRWLHTSERDRLLAKLAGLGY